MGIMQSLLRKDRQVLDVTRPVEPRVAASDAPALIFLTPDAQGIATYQLHEFRSARAAEIFVDVTLRGQVSHGSVAFWALTFQPDADHYAEPLVLIRDTDRPVVYLFSFADLDSCFDFVRHEMTRGLELQQVMTYWAVPATVGVDFWGRAAVSPASAPRRAYVVPPEPVPAAIATRPAQDSPPSVIRLFAREGEMHDKTGRYLAEADIAETMREMKEFTAKFDAERPEVIDFPTASTTIRRTKKAQRAALTWANFASALDEALDVHVARQVRIQLALNRTMRALAQAAFLQQAAASEQAAHKPAVVDAERQAWFNASIALADAGAVAIRRALMRRVWMNTAWTMEEAVYAHRLETNARARRSWFTAGQALHEIANAKVARDGAVIKAWAQLSTEFAHAAETQVKTQRARLVWANFAKAIKDATKSYAQQRKQAVLAWTRVARAIKLAIAAQEKQRKQNEKASLAAARAEAKAVQAAAKAAERAQRKAAREAELAAAAAAQAQPSPMAMATEEPPLSEEEQIALWLEKQGVATSESQPAGKKSRWEPHVEPFDGFRSPPGRF